MSAFTEARMHLGIEVGGAGQHPGAALAPGSAGVVTGGPVTGGAVTGAAHHLPLIRTAALQGLDHVTVPATVDLGAGPVPLDAVGIAAAVAPLVDAVGIVPTVPALGSCHASTAVETLVAASAGRAGWQPATPSTDAGWAELGRTLEAVERLRGAGADRLPVVLRADDPESLPLVARFADVVRIAARGLDEAHTARQRVRAALSAAGRDPESVPVLLDVEVHLAADRHRAATEVAALDAAAGFTPAPSSVRVVGTVTTLAAFVERTLRLRAADGITFLPLVLPTDLRHVTDELIPLLAGRGLYRAGRPGGLRSRLGLTVPQPAERERVSA